MISKLNNERDLRMTLHGMSMAIVSACALLYTAPQTFALEPSSADKLASQLESLPTLTGELAAPITGDWLITPAGRKSGVYRSGPHEITMSNRLVRRTWRVAPNGATVGLDNLMTGDSMLRGVKPELRLTLDGKDYDVGGLNGQPNYAYLRAEWLDTMTADPAAFQLTGFEVGPTKERFAWKRVRYAADLPWPPPGVALTLQFAPPPGSNLGNLTVSVHYEMYDGIPLLCKWFTLHNGNDKPVRLNHFTSEILAAVEGEASVGGRDPWRRPNMHVESDYAFIGMDSLAANKTVFWVPDPQYVTQIEFNNLTPALLESRPPIGPEIDIEPDGTFESFRTFELLYDSTERERNGLALRRMYRTIAPWVTENPILMHVSSAEPAAVRLAIDQSADVGFEMVIMTFFSGFNIENEDPAYIEQIKQLVHYANGKGVELGGYSLLSSRGDTGPNNEVVDAKTGKPGGAIFGQAPCLGSDWGVNYFRKLYAFHQKTGLNVLEHDGSYPGDTCASTTHPGHRGQDDSQWRQWKTITDFYKWCRGQGVYLNVPDYYFLTGSTKIAMGYKETNWSLPRAQQIIHARQNIFDGTWEKTPSMGWMFVPLVQYHGGGEAATIEPLCEHLADYEAHLANCFGAGVQACYRGPRLYDTDATKAVVKKWVDFYKEYRPILDSDLIHVRRADARDIDCVLHVNPQLKQKGLAVVFNPLDQPVKRTLKLPLYYTGLSDTATIRREQSQPIAYKLDRQYNVELPIEMAPNSVTWFVIE